MKIKVQTKNLTLVKTQETKEDSNGCLELAEKRRLASWSVENFKGKKTTFFYNTTTRTIHHHRFVKTYRICDTKNEPKYNSGLRVAMIHQSGFSCGGC